MAAWQRTNLFLSSNRRTVLTQWSSSTQSMMPVSSNRVWPIRTTVRRITSTSTTRSSEIRTSETLGGLLFWSSKFYWNFDDRNSRFRRDHRLIETNFFSHRDPNVFWYESYYVMVLAAGDRVQFYNSTNLKDWEFLSEFGNNPGQGERRGVWVRCFY